MNKLAQFELSYVGVIFGVIGGLLSVFIASKMVDSVMMMGLSFIITGVTCYAISSKILSN